MSVPTRLALLICDTPIPEVLSAHGDYLAQFHRLLTASCPPGVEFILDPYDVVHKQDYPEDAGAYDGIIMTGSAYSAYQDVPWIDKLVEYTGDVARSKPHVKIIGICFGHQIVARALGGECVPNGGKWEVGITEIELTELGKNIFNVSSLNIQQMHRDHVPAVPPSFHLLGSTPICFNQGMVRFTSPDTPISASSDSCTIFRNIHILTVQGHPEFTHTVVSKVIDARTASGVLDIATAEVARGRARDGWRDDGVSVLGKAIWRVFRDHE